MQNCKNIIYCFSKINIGSTKLNKQTYLQENTYEFPAEQLEILREVGEGTFGKVFMAKAYQLSKTKDHQYVAVKQLKGKQTLQISNDK